MKQPARSRDKRLRAALRSRTPWTGENSVCAPLFGRRSRVMLNSGESVPIRYAVVEASWLITSHRGLTYERDRRYPVAAQPRDYRAEFELRLAVETRAGNLDPLRLLSDSVLSVDGPPITRADGVVLSGNGRAQSICLAIERGLYGEVLEGVLERTQHFGLDGDSVRRLRSPVLVRIMEEYVTEPAGLARYGIEMNRDPGQGMSSTEQAIAYARIMTPPVVERLASLVGELPAGYTLRDFLRLRSRDVASVLGAGGLIDARKRSVYFTATGELTEAAKELVQTTLAGLTVTDIDILRNASRPILDRLVRGGIEFMRMRSAGSEWDLARFNDEAVRLVTVAEDRAAYLRMLKGRNANDRGSLIERLLHPERFNNAAEEFDFGMRLKPHPAAEALALCLEENPRDYVAILKTYAERATGNWDSMFECVLPAAAFSATIGRPPAPGGGYLWDVLVPDGCWRQKV